MFDLAQPSVFHVEEPHQTDSEVVCILMFRCANVSAHSTDWEVPLIFEAEYKPLGENEKFVFGFRFH